MNSYELPRFGLRFYFTLITLIEMLIAIAIGGTICYICFQKLYVESGILFLLLILLTSSLIGTTFAVLAGRVFLSPIMKLRAAMEKVSRGDFDQYLQPAGRMKEITELYASFNTMTKELKATEILQTDFVSNVSHEFKTPISSINGYATLLQDPSLNEAERNEYIDKILFNSRVLSDLIGNTLLLSKLDNRAIQPKCNSYHLDEQIRQAILLLEPRWEPKNIEFDIELDSMDYTGPESLMMHVWTNLIGNAIKFAPDEGIVRINLIMRDNHPVFTVADNGPGISPEDRKHVFDKFYQADSSHKSEGNGLGLALVKQITTMVGGTVEIQDSDLGGAQFCIKL